MRTQPALFDIDSGLYEPAGPLDGSPVVSVNTTLDYLSYNANDNLRVPGHRHFMLAPWQDAYIGGGQLYPILADPLLSGIVLTTTWRTLEPSKGTYDLTVIKNAVATCKALDRDLILRIFDKNYYVGAKLPYPDYVGAMANATYPVYQGGHAVGTGAMLENPEVRRRWKMLQAVIAAAFAFEPCLVAVIGPDESARSAWNGSGLPAGVTMEAVVESNMDVWSHCRDLFGASRTMPCINYVDGTETQAVTNAASRMLLSWAVAEGMSIAVSDAFDLPRQMSQYLQPPYFDLPHPDQAPGTLVVGHVDQMSLKVPADGSMTLDQVMVSDAVATYRLGCNVTAWNVNPNGGPEIWASQKRAIQSTAAYRPVA